VSLFVFSLSFLLSDFYLFALYTQVDWIEWDAGWMALQLTLIHWDMVSDATPRELLEWNSTKKKVNSFSFLSFINSHKQREDCPNLWKLIQHFNHLVSWAISEIVVRVRLNERGEE
jgi:hypothetical protein